MKEIFEGILKFIFIVILATFLFWTGEILISAITVGWHRPKWKGYKEKTPVKRVLCEGGAGFTGFLFWIFIIPTVITIFDNFNAV